MAKEERIICEVDPLLWSPQTLVGTHLLFIRNWTDIAKCGMSPHPVVEALHILEDALPCLASGLEASTFNTLSLQRSEKRLGDRIIVAVSRATHTHGEASLSKNGSIRITGILRSPIRMRTAPALMDVCQAEPCGKQPQSAFRLGWPPSPIR